MKYLRKIRIPKVNKKISILVAVAVMLILVNLVVLFAVILPAAGRQPDERLAAGSAQPNSSDPITGATETPAPPQTIQTSDELPDLLAGSSVRQGMVVFSMVEKGYSHLFTFSPGDPILLRLTGNQWDDQTPAISPDGTRIAYGSRRNGYWDLYILNLLTGETLPVTDTPEYIPRLPGHRMANGSSSNLISTKIWRSSSQTYLENQYPPPRSPTMARKIMTRPGHPPRTRSYSYPRMGLAPPSGRQPSDKQPYKSSP